MINTEKLELPSITQVQTRGQADAPWYSSSQDQRSGGRLPELQLPQLYGSIQTLHHQSHPLLYTNKTTDIGLKTPSPSPTSQTSPTQGHSATQDLAEPSTYTHQIPYSTSPEQYVTMDHQQQQQYLASQQSHMSQGQSYAPQSSTAGGIPQYPSYQTQQPPVLQPAPHSYAPSQSSYSQGYTYANGMPSPHGSGQPVSSSMAHPMNSGLPPLPTMTGGGAATFVGNPNGPQPSYQQQSPDQTGQVAPTGMKPRVTATLWEDEGCMCFQIEAKGICVARRDDNHMINGTKLLNVAGMTRGRRDGILKSEKTRAVVKIGPMHLKGVWIPFDRALDFANKEKITETLYPLFVHNIGALLYHPTNQTRTNAVMAAADRRRLDSSKPGGMVGPPGPQPPNLTHHHTMNSTVGGQQPGSLATHSGVGRPGLDRAHTFPTPPTSASGTVASGMGSQWSSYDSAGSGMNSGQVQQFEHHPHSTPATPATTPPGSNLPSMQPYQSHQQTYDTSRPMYSAATSQQPIYASQLPNQAMTRNGSLQSNGYASKEMGPPIGNSAKSEGEHGEQKLASYLPNHEHNHGDEEAEHEQDAEYAHDSKYSYDAQRAQYNGISMGTNGYQNGSGHVTPQTSATSGPLWAAGHPPPPRAPPSSNLYNPTSDTRGALPNGNVASDGHVPGAYAPTQMNGTTPSNKRLRDDEDAYPKAPSDDIDAIKRRKMGREGSSAGLTNGAYDETSRSINRAKSSASARTRR